MVALLMLESVGYGGFILWEVSPSGLRVLAKHKSGGNLLNFSPDSKMLFSSNVRDSHIIIDVSKPAEIIERLALGSGDPLSFLIVAIAISPDWQTLAVGGDCELELWQRTASGWNKRLNSRANCQIQLISFGENGNTLLVGGSYNPPQVHLYDLSGESPKPIRAFTGLREAALSMTASSTGKMFAATDVNGRVIVWSRSGEKLHEWKFPGPVPCIAFAPDGRHLALGNGDGTVYILRLTVPAVK